MWSYLNARECLHTVTVTEAAACGLWWMAEDGMDTQFSRSAAQTHPVEIRVNVFFLEDEVHAVHHGQPVIQQVSRPEC